MFDRLAFKCRFGGSIAKHHLPPGYIDLFSSNGFNLFTFADRRVGQNIP
jgi:hypothetical protein